MTAYDWQEQQDDDDDRVAFCEPIDATVYFDHEAQAFVWEVFGEIAPATRIDQAAYDVIASGPAPTLAEAKAAAERWHEARERMIDEQERQMTEALEGAAAAEASGIYDQEPTAAAPDSYPTLTVEWRDEPLETGRDDHGYALYDDEPMEEFCTSHRNQAIDVSDLYGPGAPTVGYYLRDDEERGEGVAFSPYAIVKAGDKVVGRLCEDCYVDLFNREGA